MSGDEFYDDDVTSGPIHTGIPQLKDGGDFTEIDGTYVPPTELYRIACSCGWRGVWYTDVNRAGRSFDVHRELA